MTKGRFNNDKRNKEEKKESSIMDHDEYLNDQILGKAIFLKFHGLKVKAVRERGYEKTRG